MRDSTRKLALSAILSAMAVALLFVSCLTPTMQLAVIAFAGLLSAVVLIECGISWSVLVWLCTALLSFLLLPDKSSALFYLLYFGHYPIVKYLTETIRKPWLEWTAKLGVCHICLAAIWLLLKLFFSQWTAGDAVWYLMWLACVAVFVLYDLAMTRLLVLYQHRIRPKFQRYYR